MIVLKCIITICLLLFGGVVYYSNRIVYPKTRDVESSYISEVEKGYFNPDYLDSFEKETIYIDSEHGYKLHGIIYRNKNSNDFVLFCHGITTSFVSSLKYLEIFLNRGYSVLVYDHRNHGRSDKNYTSFGFFEKEDAKLWVDYLHENYNNVTVGVHGESMGASIALQLVTIDDRVNFCIEDCGYSNAFELFKYRSSKDNIKFVSLLTYPAGLYIKLRYKWSFSDVSVERYINKAKCPIMFIHGDSDSYVPTYMVHKLFKSYNSEKMIYIAKDATHAQAYKINPKEYKNKVYEFLDRYDL